MNGVSHFRLMSKYNSRMNNQVYTAALALPSDALHQDKGAFFKSINGTLNHILVGDILWFTRFVAHSPNYQSLRELSSIATPNTLDEVLYEDTQQLFEVRQKVDRLIERWLQEELTEDDLQRNLVYKTTKGIRGCRVFAAVLSHVFNHQTHHRGQVSTLLFQCGIDVGVTDFLIDIPESE